MDTAWNHRNTLAFLAAFFAPLGLAAVLVPFRGSFTNTAAALVFVAVIAAVAVAGNRITGVITTVSAGVWFDFFLTTPYERLAISHRPDIETTACLLVVGVIVTELAARNRHHFQVATEESDYVAMIHDLAELATGSASTSIVIQRAMDSLSQLLDLRACRFETGPAGHRLPRIQADGAIIHAGLRWPAHEGGIPGPEAEILVQWRGQIMGRIVFTPTPGLPVSANRLVVARSLADLVGAVVHDHQRAA